MKTKRTKLVSRGGGDRDARLFVIAPEGHETERQYFEGLQRQGVIDRRRVIIEIVTPDQGDTSSAPAHVIARLDAFKRRHQLHEIDQLWLVLDFDHWGTAGHVHNLKEVVQKARDKGYLVAVSNPCFELWLLLHFTADIDDIHAMDDAHSACQACSQKIRALCGSYKKSNIRVERYTAQRVETAISRAEALEQSPDARWPKSVGTHVYRLARELVEQSRRNASLPRQGAPG